MTHLPLHIADYQFEYVQDIVPDRAPDGQYIELMPQERYKGYGIQRLNSQGSGSFCRFTFTNRMPYSGVYALTVDSSVVYVGECKNLSVRWGLGQFGSIQPKNCFVGGQSTNCKINSRILKNATAGLLLRLWFHRTTSHKAIEKNIFASGKPPWNE